MWIISKTGFVSLVEHDTNPAMLRARARRAEHLTGTFPIGPDDVIDLGAACPDYRYHANVDREAAAAAIANTVLDVDYSSHVKEEVSGNDRVMYSAMLACWTALHRLQDPPEPDAGWWGDYDANDRWEYADTVDDDDLDGIVAEIHDLWTEYADTLLDETPSRGDLDGIVAEIHDLSEKLKSRPLPLTHNVI